MDVTGYKFPIVADGRRVEPVGDRGGLSLGANWLARQNLPVSGVQRLMAGESNCNPGNAKVTPR